MGTDSQSRKERKKQTRKFIKKLKMVMLLVVSVVLFHENRSSCKIHNYLVGLVDNVDMLIQYPWGRHYFIHLLRQLQKTLKEKGQTLLKEGNTESSIGYQGFVYHLAINKNFQDNIILLFINIFYV